MFSPAQKRLLERAPLLVPILLLLPELGYVPIFDGREYANCIVGMARQPSLDGLACAGHPTHAYVLWASLVQKLAPTSSWPLVVSHVALTVVALAAIGRLLRRLWPDDDAWGERAAALFAVASNPTVLACTLQPNADLGVLAGIALTLDALVARNVAYAIGAGLFAVFSKEMGLLLYTAAVAMYAFAFVARGEAPLRERQRALAMQWPLLVPIAVALARLAWRALATTGPAIVAPPTHVTDTQGILGAFLSFELLDKMFLSYSAGIFVMQFQWLVTAPIAVWLARGVHRWLFDEPAPRTTERRDALFAVGFFFVAWFFVTRYRTYSSPRYWVATLPPMVLAAATSLRALGVAVERRRAYLALVGVLSFGSAFATFDPVSRALYGTFRFGEHTMLKAASIGDLPHERLSGGRDALPYNLQFANVHYLQNEIFALAGERGTALLVDSQSEWHLWDNVDPRGRRTLDPTAVQLPKILARLDGGELTLLGDERATGRESRFLYTVYPMFEATQRPILAELTKRFALTGQTQVSFAGYTAEVYELRPGAPPPVPNAAP
jgi:hypothetical protein